MKDLIISFLFNHQDYFLGLATGYALSHIPQMISGIFNAAMKVPMIRNYVLAHPEELKKAIDEVEQALDREIDEEVAENKAKTDPAKTDPK